MAKLKSTKTYSMRHLVLVATLSALIGILATSLVSAKKSASILVYGASSCPNGVWTVDARITSTYPYAVNLDVYDSSDAPGSRKIASNVSLAPFAVHTFQFTPPADQRKDKITVVPAGQPFANRVNEARIETACAKN